MVTGQHGNVWGVKKKKKPPMENVPPVDEAEFTDVIRKMVNTPPTPLEDVKRERRKNPDYERLPLLAFRESKPKK